MTVMAWNFSLFRKEEDEHFQRLFLDTLPKQFAAEDVALLSESIDILVARKKRDYPDIREFILSYDLSFSGDMLTLSVSTAPVPETIQGRYHKRQPFLPSLMDKLEDLELNTLSDARENQPEIEVTLDEL